MPIVVSSLGFPRIGAHRELKTALESYWTGKSDAPTLLAQAARLRATAWAQQKALGVEQIPSNDFSLYDHVLDATVMLGAIPPAYGWNGGPVSLDTYSAMARGRQSATPDEHGHAQAAQGSRPAMEMTNGTRRWSTWWQPRGKRGPGAIRRASDKRKLTRTLSDSVIRQ